MKADFGSRGQSYKDFYTLGQNYKLVLKPDNVLWLRKYLVKILGHYTLKYSQSNFFDRGTIGNLGTLFYTSQRLKLLYRIGPWCCLCHLPTFLPEKGARELAQWERNTINTKNNSPLLTCHLGSNNLIVKIQWGTEIFITVLLFIRNMTILKHKDT